MASHPDPLFSYPPPMTKEFGWFSKKDFFSTFLVPPPVIPVIPAPEPINHPVPLIYPSSAEYWKDSNLARIENDSEDLFSGFLLM